MNQSSSSSESNITADMLIKIKQWYNNDDHFQHFNQGDLQTLYQIMQEQTSNSDGTSNGLEHVKDNASYYNWLQSKMLQGNKDNEQ